MAEMNKKALASIKKYNMIEKGDTVASCLSGGADSMALFHFLCSNREAFGIKVIALHVNHGLREESEDEERFVKEYCEKLGVECVVKRLGMTRRQKPRGESTETWRRNLRYEFFFEQAEKYGAKLATAHTLSDRTETVLFNTTRGTGLKGLIGIPPVRDNIIRPLIDCTRADIESYCAENGIEFVTDKTNFEDIYSRNKIRLNVIPRLKKINPNFEGAIANLSRETEEIYTFLTQLSDNLYNKSLDGNGLNTVVLNKAEPCVTKHLIRNILSEKGCLSKENVDFVYNAVKKGGAKHQLSADVFCVVKNGRLTFEKPHAPTEAVCVKINPGSATDFLGKTYLIKRHEGAKTKDRALRYIDTDKIKGGLYLRNRRIGDAFTLRKRNVTKTVKKLFIEDKIPPADRDRIPILTDDSGKVIWLGGYGTNREYYPSADSARVLSINIISVRENSNDK